MDFFQFITKRPPIFMVKRDINSNNEEMNKENEYKKKRK